VSKERERVVFVFSDAAGANACLAQAFILQKENNCEITCFSNKQNFHEAQWPFLVQLKEKITESDLQNADVLFTGTSHPESSSHFELKAIQLAKSKYLNTIAYVDHWTNISLRFEWNGEMVYPNEVWLPDQMAQTMAIKEGVPEKIIQIRKNPYLAYLASHWKSVYPEKGYAKKLLLPSSKKIIVIAPDPISLRTKDFDPGFTEVSALTALLESIQKSGMQDRVAVVIKAHPLQPVEVLLPALNHFISLGLTLKVLTESNNPELINIADLVIGFYSNFLLEAREMNKSVVRYFPGNSELDPLKHLVDLPSISNASEALLSLQSLFPL